MAIYGIGAYYDNNNDVSEDFVHRGVACVGWSRKDAPAIHRLLDHIKAGDIIIYIKAHPPGRSLTVKAVGIVEREPVDDFEGLGRGLHVRWLWRGPAETLQESTEERNNVRANTLYEEFSETVQARILGLLFSAFGEAEVRTRGAVQG